MSNTFVSLDATHEKQATPFTFIKDHGALFGLYLKTVVLTLLTLGIYSFWGRAAISRYIYNHTSFARQPFNYHATGKELFLGFLKGLCILALFGTGIMLIFLGLNFIFAKMHMAYIATIFIGLVYAAAIIFVTPYIILGKWRFLLSRSSWCNIRFANDGVYKEIRNIWIPGILLSIITLGLYSFVMNNRLMQYLYNKSRFGTLNFTYDGISKEFFWLSLKGVLLTVVTIGIYSPWYIVSLNKYIMSHTALKSYRFNSTMTGGKLFLIMITNILLIVCTLSLAFPVALNRMNEYYFSNLTFEANGSELVTLAGTMDKGASALANGLEEAANVIDAVSGII